MFIDVNHCHWSQCFPCWPPVVDAKGRNEYFSENIVYNEEGCRGGTAATDRPLVDRTGGGNLWRG